MSRSDAGGLTHHVYCAAKEPHLERPTLYLAPRDGPGSSSVAAVTLGGRDREGSTSDKTQHRPEAPTPRATQENPPGVHYRPFRSPRSGPPTLPPDAFIPPALLLLLLFCSLPPPQFLLSKRLLTHSPSIERKRQAKRPERSQCPAHLGVPSHAQNGGWGRARRSEEHHKQQQHYPHCIILCRTHAQPPHPHP